MPRGPKGQHPTIWIIDKKLATPDRKKLNAAQRHDLKAASVQLFAKEYARRAQRGCEPNDRQFDKKVIEQVKHMKPEDLYRLLHHGEDD
jgi:hypothetical protein